MRSLALNRFAIYFVILVLSALSINGFILAQVLTLHTKTLVVQQLRQDSLQITQDIQNETSALSRMVRAYTTSANTKYLTYYYDIIDIRQGKKASPEEYDTTYWARVMAGERVHVMPSDRPGVSLFERMETYGFSPEEFASINRVLKCVNRLYELDQIAFAATQGLYDPERRVFVDDGTPQPQFANQFVYSDHYLQLESDLSQEIRNFVQLTDERTTAAVRNVSLQHRQSIFAAVIILGMTVVIVLIAMGVIRKMVLAPMKGLMRSTLELGGGDYSRRVDTGQGVRELQALGQTFNAMAQNIQEDILQREQIQSAFEMATIKADESTKAKSLFLANMSHEIRTPMNAIIGMSYLALNTHLDERQRDYVSKIQNAAQSLLGIINDILDFSKIEAGKLLLDRITFRLEDVISNALVLIRQRAIEKGLELLLDIKNPQLLGDSGTFWGDPIRLGQVLTNLLTNAVKFTDQGNVKFSIEERRRQGNTAELRLCVEDTGIGMTPEQLSQLFQEFSQVDGSTTRKQGGTGLGLSISKRILTQMGGRITVASQPRKGSQFTCVLTLQASAQAAHLDVTCQGLKALVVDDHEPARTVLRTLLGHLGIESGEAASGEAALRILSQPDVCFDLLFIDWVMPGMNGEELIAAVRKLPVQPPPVIVVVSAYDLDRIHVVCEQQKICHFLPKPVLPTELRKLFWETRHPHTADEPPLPFPGTTHLEGMRVLVTEDNLINQQVTSELLAFSGVEVDIASNGQEAVEMIGSHPDDYYQAVLMDIQMPVMDGYEATRILRSQPRYNGLPIIAMTAHAMVEEQQRCQALGMNAHVAKPIEPIVLHRALAAYYIPADGPSSRSTAEQESVGTVGGNPPGLLPDHLPGIDLKIGLSLCANKPALYCKVLKGFARTYKDLAGTLHQHRDQEEWDEISNLGHSFKGLAGTIGAQGLYDLGAQIEKGAKMNAQHVKGLIMELTEQLPCTIDAINTYFAGAEDRPAEPTSSCEDASDSTLLLEQLRQLLRESDSAVQDFWKDHETALKKRLPPDTVQALVQALAHSQFQEALERLSQED